MEDSTPQHRLHIAKGIAANLGQGWTVLQVDWHPSLTVEHKESGRAFWLRWEGRPERIYVNGHWPKNRDGRESFPDKERPSISVSPAKKPAQIAADITRRFLPAYDEQFWLQVARVNSRNAYADLTEQTARALEALGAKRGNNHDGTNINLYLGSDNHLYNLVAQGDTVRIEHCSVPVAVAVAIIPLCRKTEEEL